MSALEMIEKSKDYTPLLQPGCNKLCFFCTPCPRFVVDDESVEINEALSTIILWAYTEPCQGHGIEAATDRNPFS